MSIDYRLYLVTDRPCCLGRDLLEVVAAAARGGATVVQLREKACATREFVELARAVKGVLAPLGVPLIINDRVDVALAVGADGVHVGQDDMAVEDVRRLVGPDLVIGLSVTTDEEARQAARLPVDYLGVGPVFATATKPDAGDPIGLDGLRRIRSLTPQPLVAIGAVTAANAAEIMTTGVAGVAVVSAICSAPSPEDAARALRRIVEGS